jgi:hypothetical protein
MDGIQTNLIMKTPAEVFTPRSAKVNPQMYVQRLDLEQVLKLALAESKHIIIHGESGSGKTWLYKSVLASQGSVFKVADLANANRFGSIGAELKELVATKGEPTLEGYSEKKAAEVNIQVAKGSLENVRNYSIPDRDPFVECLEMLRKEAGTKPAYLVFDNLERMIGNSKLLDELADLVTLVDNERYSQFHIKILIVGVPSIVKEYFNKTPTRATVTNRIKEIREVSRLSPEECDRLVAAGFVKELQYSSAQLDVMTVQNHIRKVTDRIPQRVHEYCLELAQLCVSDRRLDPVKLPEADKAWLRSQLSDVYQMVERVMNERETKAQRRNQVLFSLGQFDKEEFRHTDIEPLVREHFASSVQGITLNVSQVLSELASGHDKLLKRSIRGDAYLFIEPRIRMCLRAMLRKNGDKVERVEIQGI